IILLVTAGTTNLLIEENFYGKENIAKRSAIILHDFCMWSFICCAIMAASNNEKWLKLDKDLQNTNSLDVSQSKKQKISDFVIFISIHVILLTILAYVTYTLSNAMDSFIKFYWVHLF